MNAFEEGRYVYEITIKPSRRPAIWGLSFHLTRESAKKHAAVKLRELGKGYKLVSIRCIGQLVGHFCQID